MPELPLGAQSRESDEKNWGETGDSNSQTQLGRKEPPNPRSQLDNENRL
jgi:hypothetical protein